MQVSELFSDDEDFFTSGESFTGGDSDDEDYFTSGESFTSESDTGINLFCCVYGNCFCHSLYHALANLTSNVLINITTDVTLFSHIKVSNLENISVIGQNNPTVNYKNAGGIHFTFCHNCIIQGIIWDGCGGDTNAESVLKFAYPSNITIQNCTFQHSIGQAMVLSEVSGCVNIDHCNFVYNSHYRGHGAAIYYSSYASKNSSFVFTINNCNFTHNKHAKSYIYINKRNNEHNHITLNSSTFLGNEGIPIFILNHKLCVIGRNSFQNNRARKGAGIYISSHSTIVFGDSSNVVFIYNSANSSGAAVFLINHSNNLC